MPDLQLFISKLIITYEKKRELSNGVQGFHLQ